MVLVLCRISAFGFNGCCFVFLLKFTIVVIGLNHRCFDIHNQLFRLTQSVVSTYTISCYDLHNQLFRHTQSVVSTYTISCFDIHNQLFRHTQSVVSTYTFSCFDLHIQLFRLTQSVVSTYTISCFDIHNQLFRHTKSVVSTYTFSCFDLHNQLLRLTQSVVSTYTISCFDIHNQLFRHTQSVVSTYAISCFDLHIQLFRLTHSVVSTYTISCFDIHNQLFRHTQSVVSTYEISCFDLHMQLFRLTQSVVTTYTISCYEFPLGSGLDLTWLVRSLFRPSLTLFRYFEFHHGYCVLVLYYVWATFTVAITALTNVVSLFRISQVWFSQAYFRITSLFVWNLKKNRDCPSCLHLICQCMPAISQSDVRCESVYTVTIIFFFCTLYRTLNLWVLKLSSAWNLCLLQLQLYSIIFMLSLSLH